MPSTADGPLQVAAGRPHGGELLDSSQAQLRRLIEANRLAVEHLDLSLALRQIIGAAVDLVGAGYGAIGVLGVNGRLDEFIHVGMDAETVRRIGDTPEGLGLLGALIQDPKPVRLAALSDDARSVGVPAHHPMINSFLGVPLEVREEVYGHLYLADARVGAFTAEDQVLVEALATTAGGAIAHARLFEDSKRRVQWTAATTEITHELLTNDDVDALQLIATRVLELSAAHVVAVVLTHGGDAHGDLVVDRAAGPGAERLLGLPVPREGSLVRRCLESQRPQLVEQHDPGVLRSVLTPELVGPAMAVPLPADSGSRGSLFVLRPRGASRFTEFDLDMAASLAGHAALALDRADARIALARHRRLEDRDRIARDLHDHVVQRLFAAGLSIQSVCSALGPGAATDRLGAQVDEIDATIRQIRTTIFGLQGQQARGTGLRAQVLSAVSAATAVLPSPPDVTFRGPLDVLVPDTMYADAVAVVRESLTNAGRHARARHVSVSVSADPRELRIEVLDDGCGVPDDATWNGLANLAARARAAGGSFTLTPREGPGTRLRWVAALEPSGVAPDGRGRHHGDVARGVLDHGR